MELNDIHLHSELLQLVDFNILWSNISDTIDISLLFYKDNTQAVVLTSISTLDCKLSALQEGKKYQ